MLINNLREHRQKYSQKLQSSPSKSLASNSLMKGTGQAKTENEYKFKNKMASEKRLKVQNTFRKGYYTGSERGKFGDDGLCYTAVERKIGEWGSAGKGGLNFFKSEELFTDSNQKTQMALERHHERLHKVSKIQKRPEKKSQKSIQPFTEQYPEQPQPPSTSTLSHPSSPSPSSNPQKPQPQTAPQTKPNTRTDLLNFPSAVTTKSNYKSIVLQKEKTKEQRAREEELISGLRINQLFFCALCYRYVFAIEKGYHYPQCKQPFEEAGTGMTAKQKYKQGLQKLKLLVQLADYTKYKKQPIKALYKACSQHSLPQLPAETPNRTYFSLLQIQTAAHIIINKLIVEHLVSSGGELFCGNVRCDVDYQI